MFLHIILTVILKIPIILYSLLFYKTVQEELSRISRYKQELALLMFDIDHFKNLNDSLGHLAGHRVLFDVTDILKTNIRQSDVAARFGG